jgi:hypothetical protein
LPDADRTPLKDSSDAGISASLKAISAAKWVTLGRLTRELASAADHGFINESWTDDEGVFHINYRHEYPDALWKLVDFLYRNKLIVDFDWMNWKRFGDDPLTNPAETKAVLAQCSIEDAVRLATGIARAERFSDGVLGQALASGLLLAIFERILGWGKPVKCDVVPPARQGR